MIGDENSFGKFYFDGIPPAASGVESTPFSTTLTSFVVESTF